MTQVMMDEVSLEEALARANLVAVVTLADPPTRTEEIPMPRPAAGGGVAPPYGLHLRRLRVDEILFQRPGRGASPVEVGAVIEARPASWRIERSTHEAYYCDDLGESPILQSYVGSCPPDATTYLAFLSLEARELRFAIDGGQEALACRAQVDAILAGRA